MFTVDDVREALPAHLKGNANQDIADMLNKISDDPEAAQTIRDNFVSYSLVLRDGKYKMRDYVKAVAYVSYKMMGYTNREAYVKTFPDRYKAHVANGATDKDIAAYIAVYNRGKLVNMILEQSIIPSWILNQDAYQKAINVQVSLMNDPDVSPKVRSDAANSILLHLKKPEEKAGAQLNINLADNSGMDELNKTLREMSEMQQKLIQQGMSTKNIAHQRIIDAEVISDDE